MIIGSPPVCGFRVLSQVPAVHEIFTEEAYKEFNITDKSTPKVVSIAPRPSPQPPPHGSWVIVYGFTELD